MEKRVLLYSLIVIGKLLKYIRVPSIPDIHSLERNVLILTKNGWQESLYAEYRLYPRVVVRNITGLFGGARKCACLFQVGEDMHPRKGS